MANNQLNIIEITKASNLLSHLLPSANAFFDDELPPGLEELLDEVVELELDPEVDDCVVDCCCWTTGAGELPPPPPPHAETTVLAINAKSNFLVKESI